MKPSLCKLRGCVGSLILWVVVVIVVVGGGAVGTKLLCKEALPNPDYHSRSNWLYALTQVAPLGLKFPTWEEAWNFELDCDAGLLEVDLAVSIDGSKWQPWDSITSAPAKMFFVKAVIKTNSP